MEIVKKLLSGKNSGAIMARGVTGSFLVRVSGALLLLLLNLVLARAMGAEGYGAYIYVLTWVWFMALIGRLGLDTASIRFVSTYLSGKEWGLLAGYLIRARQSGLMVSLAIALFASLVTLALGDRIDKTLQPLFLISFVAIPLHALLLITGAFLQARKAIVAALAPPTVLQPLLMTVFVGALYMVSGQPVTPATAMTAFVVTMALCLLVSHLLWRSRVPTELVNVEPQYKTARWLRTGFSLFMVAGFYLVVEQTDIILIGLMQTTTDAGIYAVAVKLSRLVSFGLIVGSAIVAPMIAELHAAGQMEKVQRVATTGVALAITIALPVAFLFAVFGTNLLNLFGHEFGTGYLPLLILTLGQLLNVVCGFVGYFMSMTGNEKALTRVAAISALLNLLLNLVLIPIYGSIGAAIATTLSVGLWNIWLAIIIAKKSRIDMTAISLPKLLRHHD